MACEPPKKQSRLSSARHKHLHPALAEHARRLGGRMASHIRRDAMAATHSCTAHPRPCRRRTGPFPPWRGQSGGASAHSDPQERHPRLGVLQERRPVPSRPRTPFPGTWHPAGGTTPRTGTRPSWPRSDLPDWAMAFRTGAWHPGAAPPRIPSRPGIGLASSLPRADGTSLWRNSANPPSHCREYRFRAADETSLRRSCANPPGSHSGTPIMGFPLHGATHISPRTGRPAPRPPPLWGTGRKIHAPSSRSCIGIQRKET